MPANEPILIIKGNFKIRKMWIEYLHAEMPESMVVEDVEAIKLMVSQDVSNSPIWDEEIRKTVTSTKKSDFEINQLKSEHLVPGLCKLHLFLLSHLILLVLFIQYLLSTVKHYYSKVAGSSDFDLS